jgi:hypothetical protein
MKRIIARTLSVLIVAFFAVFILEGFSPVFDRGDLLSHGALTLVALAITIVAWKWPRIGGWLFIASGLAGLILLKWSITAALIAGAPILAGVLFLLP